jgi:N4-gp56 family major capsid protein
MKKTIKDIKKVLALMFTLQLFAAEFHGTSGMVDPAAGTTENYTPGTPGQEGLSVEIKTFYSNSLISKANPELYHEQFGKTASIPERRGDRAEFRYVRSLPKALKPMVEGVTPQPGKVHIYPKYAEVNQFGSWVGYTDRIKLMAIDPQVETYVQELSKQAALTCDTVVRELINAGTNVQFARKSGSPAVVTKRSEITNEHLLTVQDVFKIAAIMKANNAPKIDGYYVAIAHPYVIYDLQMSAPDGMWHDVMKYAKPENIFKGEVGEIGGVRFVSTSEAKIFKGENLCESEKLTVKTAAAKGALTIEVNEELEENALIDRWVRIGDYLYMIKGNDKKSITLNRGIDAEAAQGAEIAPGEGGAANAAVFSTLFLAHEAYGVVDIGGNGIEFILKPLGYNDELNQRGSAGWKTYKGAIILHEEYMIRYESGSTMGDMVQAN